MTSAEGNGAAGPLTINGGTVQLGLAGVSFGNNITLNTDLILTGINGATIGVDKTLVNGETIYALRVTGLSKAEAAALCERLKGRDCFVAR